MLVLCQDTIKIHNYIANIMQSRPFFYIHCINVHKIMSRLCHCKVDKYCHADIGLKVLVSASWLHAWLILTSDINQ